MPRIDQEKVVTVLQNQYFDHHVAMHLSRERVDVYDPDLRQIVPVQPLLDPSHQCEDCKNMIEAGNPGSGTEFLKMHHDMIRVLRYLLHEKGIHFGVKWEHRHEHGRPSRSKWVRDCNGPDCYAPEALWNPDEPKELPTEIRAVFSNPEDQDYLREVFAGVRERVEVHATSVRGDDPDREMGPVDELGKFIERGVEAGAPGGRGFHNTIHEFLGAREGLSATGAEMNKLRNSLYNDYFWSLHFWIDGQYGRLLENLGSPFETSRLAPGDPMDAMNQQAPNGSTEMAQMHKATHSRMHSGVPA